MDFKTLYKAKGSKSQESRRAEFLQNQVKKRSELLDSHRNFLQSLEVCTIKKKEKRLDLANMLMQSEWFVSPPEDLDCRWMFKVCPEGQRCIVIAQNGKTIAVSKRGVVFHTWSSQLPGNTRETSVRNIATILDCIFVHSTNIFFILDVLHWAEFPLVDTDVMFREFWLKSRTEEMPELSVKSGNNNFIFTLLGGQPYSACTLETTLASCTNSSETGLKVDGILFYHQDGHYNAGTTPLVGWLKPFMLPEVLGIQVADNYDKPANYVSYLDYISEFDEKRKMKRRGRFKDGNDKMDAESCGGTMEDANG